MNIPYTAIEINLQAERLRVLRSNILQVTRMYNKVINKPSHMLLTSVSSNISCATFAGNAYCPLQACCWDCQEDYSFCLHANVSGSLRIISALGSCEYAKTCFEASRCTFCSHID